MNILFAFFISPLRRKLLKKFGFKLKKKYTLIIGAVLFCLSIGLFGSANPTTESSSENQNEIASVEIVEENDEMEDIYSITEKELIETVEIESEESISEEEATSNKESVEDEVVVNNAEESQEEVDIVDDELLSILVSLLIEISTFWLE